MLNIVEFIQRKIKFIHSYIHFLNLTLIKTSHLGFFINAIISK